MEDHYSGPQSDSYVDSGLYAERIARFFQISLVQNLGHSKD